MPRECLPFLKWAGGKRKITGLLHESFPKTFFEEGGNFFEPFVGGGALALSLGDHAGTLNVPGKRIFINDMNPDLVIAYEVIRDDVEGLMQKLDLMEKELKALRLPEVIAEEKERLNGDGNENIEVVEEYSRAHYFYNIRAEEPKEKIDIAARLIFLNKTCFNGLWRVNSKGKFNVPFGHHKNPSLYDRENLQECHHRLQGASISHKEFNPAVAGAKKGDLVYFDPPYIPLNLTSSFSQYSKNDFGLEEQRKLADTIKLLTERGVYVVLSNSDTPETREIFGDVVKLRRILMSRFISASGNNRNSVYEVIGTNFQVEDSSALALLESI
jgi:DNA adenine methylase